MAQIGNVQVASAAQYESGSTQWVVEEFTYVQFQNDPIWCVPAWYERSCNLECRYPTREAAENAMAEYLRYYR